jgi:hypothetical protein
MSTKIKTYQVMAKVEVDVSIEVQATSLEEAIQKSSSLKEQDFITIDGEYLDGNFEITGVYKS